MKPPLRMLYGFVCNLFSVELDMIDLFDFEVVKMVFFRIWDFFQALEIAKNPEFEKYKA